jgi:glycolate oxidase
MITYKPVGKEDAVYFESLMPGRVFFKGAVSEDYGHDEMTEYGSRVPEILLLPVSAREVGGALAYCDTERIAVTARGAGTGLCGGCVPVTGGVVLSLERMNRILEIDTANMTVTAEAGVLLTDLNKALEGTGLFYPPDPGEKTATVGGNAATNAGGMRAVRYGVTRNYVLGMEAVLASGEVLRLGGKTVKTSSGYSLTDLMVGSEGTLGIMTGLTLKLIPEPGASISLLIPFADLEDCIAAVPAVLASGCEPTAVEFMEREVIVCAEHYLGKKFPDTASDAYLLIRLDRSGAEALREPMDTLTELLPSLGARDVLLADTDERKTSIWDARGAFLEAIKGSTPAMDECDVVVPRDRIAGFVRFAVRTGREQGVRICLFGHAGDGNLHVYTCRDALTEADWKAGNSGVMDALYREARNLGGEMSGEHGVGHAKRKYLLESRGESQLRLMRGIKAAFDPNGILNPGKVV